MKQFGIKSSMDNMTLFLESFGIKEPVPAVVPIAAPIAREEERKAA